MAKDAEELSIKDALTGLARSSRRDLIAGLVGLTVFPLTYFVFLRLDQFARTSFLVSVAMMLLSAIAGLAVAANADWSSTSRRNALGFASRLGAAAGLIVFFVGGGMAVLATTTRILAIGVAPGDMSWSNESTTGIVTVIFCIVPTVALGSIGCLLGARSRVPIDHLLEPLPKTDEAAPPSPKQRARSILPWAGVLFVLSLLSPAIPSSLASRTPAPPVVEKPAPEPPSILPGVEVPVVPVVQFEYIRPEGLEDARASEWTIFTQRSIAGFDKQRPAAISPDGRLLAFVESDANATLTIHDLDHDKTLHRFDLLPDLAALTWSPNSERLLCICQSDRSPFWVLEPGTGQRFDLPVTRRLWQIADRSWWWADNEILFIGDRMQASWLDLATLQLRPVEDSPHWKEISSNSTSNQPAVPTASLPATEACRMTVMPKPGSYIPPFENEGNQWQFDGPIILGVLDVATQSAAYLTMAGLTEQSMLIPSPDGSKLLVADQDKAIVYYFGLKEASTFVCSAEVPEKPDSAPDSMFRELLDGSKLGGFVCAPLKNPLNGRVIGPDRQRLRALVRLTSWEGTLAQCEVVELYSSFQPGDILGDVHYWEEGRPVLIDGAPFGNWWTPVITKEATSEPASLSPMPRWNGADLPAWAHALVYRGWVKSRSRLSSSRDISELTAGTQTEAAEIRTPSPMDMTRKIARFVRLHHDNVSSRNLEGYANDYAESVDFLDKGIVSRDYIKGDQESYFSAFSSLSEDVTEDVEVIKIRDDVYRANYSIRSFTISKKDNNKTNRVVRIMLDISSADPGRYQIVAERGKVLP